MCPFFFLKKKKAKIKIFFFKNYVLVHAFMHVSVHLSVGAQ